MPRLTRPAARTSDALPPELALAAARADALIFFFALGVALGWLIGGAA